MMTRFGVKNYKCLADVDIPLTPIHVVIGQNDAGKTSLLEAMLAFFQSSQVDLRHAFPGKWEDRDLVFSGALKPEIELKARLSSAAGKNLLQEIEYGFRVAFPECRCVEEWYENGARVKIRELSAGWTSFGFPDSLGLPDLAAVRAQIRTLLGRADMHQLDAKLMAVPAAINPKRKFRMDRDGFGLSTLLDDLLGYDPASFLRIRSQFCEYFPQFRSVRVETETAAAREYQETGIHSAGSATGKGLYLETQDGCTIRAQQASDGAILFLGFLALTHLPKPPRLILIEEPEQGIYPKRLDQVIGILRRWAEESPPDLVPQIILSTHSPYLLSSFQPEEVTVMNRTAASAVRARPLRDAPHIQERLAGGEFYLGELWYNLTEEELFGDAQLTSSY
jgi:predicted ATPase